MYACTHARTAQHFTYQLLHNRWQLWSSCLYASKQEQFPGVGISYLGKAFSSISSELLGHAPWVQRALFLAFSRNHESGDLNTLNVMSMHTFQSFGFGSKSCTACCRQATAQCLLMRIRKGHVNTAAQIVASVIWGYECRHFQFQDVFFLLLLVI